MGLLLRSQHHRAAVNASSCRMQASNCSGECWTLSHPRTLSPGSACAGTPPSALKVISLPALVAAPAGGRLTGGRARPLARIERCHDLVHGGMANTSGFASLDPDLPLSPPTSAAAGKLGRWQLQLHALASVLLLALRVQGQPVWCRLGAACVAPPRPCSPPSRGRTVSACNRTTSC